MRKPCKQCNKKLKLEDQYMVEGSGDGHVYCVECYRDMYRSAIDKMNFQNRLLQETAEKEAKEFNEPGHYHQHDMDTITFLQKGFPPHVCMGFLLGNVVKYAQRAEYKNGLEDFEKMVDYAKRALEWYKKNPSN